MHILAALNEGPPRRIAISMYLTGNAEAITAKNARVLQALHGREVEFFDSTTYPVGAPELLIEP